MERLWPHKQKRTNLPTQHKPWEWVVTDGTVPFAGDQVSPSPPHDALESNEKTYTILHVYKIKAAKQ